MTISILSNLVKIIIVIFAKWTFKLFEMSCKLYLFITIDFNPVIMYLAIFKNKCGQVLQEKLTSWLTRNKKECYATLFVLKVK